MPTKVKKIYRNLFKAANYYCIEKKKARPLPQIFMEIT